MSEFGVCEFFREKCVLVTGATGFVGKAVVEKLLRSCSEIELVYVLVREKPEGGMSVQTRLKQMLDNPIFDVLKSCDNGAALLQKITPLCGDLEQPSLGLSDSDKAKLISKVSVVIHCGASVKFDEPLAKAIRLNVNGTRKVIELCREMKNLQALVHVSTAYSNCNQSTVEEKVYPPPESAMEIIKSLREMGSDKHDFDTVLNMHNSHPNTYTFTKAIAEHFVALEAGDLPVCIVRPSVVTASLKEPVPGWIENLSGATGVIVGIGVGAQRILFADTSKIINFIPVDFVANLILCAAWETNSFHRVKLEGTNLAAIKPTVPSTPIKVYNCCTSHSNPLTLGYLFQNLKLCLRIICPFTKAARYPTVMGTTNRALYFFYDFAQQYIPALIMDFVSSSKKATALKVHYKLKQASKVLEYFTLNEWHFCTDNMSNLYGKLSKDEQKCFGFNVERINWSEYIRTYCFGVRRYIMKEQDSNLHEAQIRMNQFFKTCCIFKCSVVSLALVLVLTALINFAF